MHPGLSDPDSRRRPAHLLELPAGLRPQDFNLPANETALHTEKALRPRSAKALLKWSNLWCREQGSNLPGPMAHSISRRVRMPIRPIPAHGPTRTLRSLNSPWQASIITDSAGVGLFTDTVLVCLWPFAPVALRHSRPHHRPEILPAFLVRHHWSACPQHHQVKHTRSRSRGAHLAAVICIGRRNHGFTRYRRTLQPL